MPMKAVRVQYLLTTVTIIIPDTFSNATTVFGM